MNMSVSYNDFVDKNYYLRWTLVRYPELDDMIASVERHEDIKNWLVENTTDLYFRGSGRYVCFKNRNDAIQFKLAFG